MGRPPVITGRTRPTKPKKQARAQKRKRDDVDVEKLQQAVDELDIKTNNVTKFTDLPLSEPTKEGLASCKYTTLTDIQARAIPLALKGRDILGAAKTGSGKTLAFLVPVLENLYRQQCVGADAGLAAMILAPTRELAIQIFDVLRKIGRKGHLFAAGLVIGGNSLQEEQDPISRMNILVCTPGRILQHLSQTATFNVDNLKMLVLDEADRIMDMGFQRDVDAIVEYLPKDRQTLLFSATQTKRVSDLARLSLQDPEYVSVHEAAPSATPITLRQNYVITPLPEKLDTLWSFIQSSKKAKILVFLSSGKQVRFVYESFRKMQPGIPLLHLYGRQKQTAKLAITSRFRSANYSCLFATDVVARGLDFPAVDWVVQVDCPEDAETYIHRVGRTARYEREGRAVLFLDPSEEEGMLKRLEQKKVPIERINVRQKKQQSIRNRMQKLCMENPELKYLGQKAFKNYVRSIHLQKDKDVFKINELALEDFAASLGLPGAPRIRFVKGDDAKEKKNAQKMDVDTSDEGDEDREHSVDGPAAGAEKSKARKDGVRTKYDRMFERRNQDVLSSHYAAFMDTTDAVAEPAAAADNDNFMEVKRRIPAENGEKESNPSIANVDGNTTSAKTADGKKVVHIPGAPQPLIVDSNRRARLLTSKKALTKLKAKGTKMVFDEEGQAHPVYEFVDEAGFKEKGAAEEQRRAFLEEERRRVENVDVLDKEEERRKRRVKKERRKERERGENDVEGDGGGRVAVLDGGEEHSQTDGVDAVDVDGDEGDNRSKGKRPRKWFEEEDDDADEAAKPPGKRKRRDRKDKTSMRDEEPETLEDLEALASGLLN